MMNLSSNKKRTCFANKEISDEKKKNMPAKFLFDANFDNSSQEQDVTERLEEKFALELEQTRLEAIEEGKKLALDQIEAQTLTALEKLTHCQQDLLAQYQTALANLQQDAVKIGIATAQKLAGHLIEKQPDILLENFFSEALQTLKGRA